MKRRDVSSRNVVLITVGAGLAGALVVLGGSAHAATTQPGAKPRTLLADVIAGVRALAGLDPPSGTTATPAPQAPGSVPRSTPESTDPVFRRCAQARVDVERTGLRLPAGFQYRCPGSTDRFAGDRQHWGIMCAGASLCPNGAYIAINPAAIGPSEARMRYVVAHEICHALDVQARRPVDEAVADSCAAAHGFPRR